MPRQNRVTPLGAIVAVADRGTLMGNRGCLHDARGSIRRAWQLKRWIVCVLKFKGRKRQVMTPGHYTELFFLDEVTALASGHRPCAECQRERFNAFRCELATDAPRSAVEIDAQLHAERLAPDGSKRLHAAELDALPDGAFVLLPGEQTPLLVWRDALLVWSAAGYADRLDRPRSATVNVLTPELTVRALRGGYVPELHRSARALLEQQT